MATARHADCGLSAPHGGYAPACLPVCKTSRHPVQHEPPQRRPRRYTSATEAWGYIRPRMGIRGLFLNEPDVDLASRAFSLGLVWTVVQPTSRWMRRVFDDEPLDCWRSARAVRLRASWAAPPLYFGGINGGFWVCQRPAASLCRSSTNGVAARHRCGECLQRGRWTG
ncbi:hypothetical protein GH5_05619 [Leishmania sp. Ghana 2012 LV757]|uniref:hypothetical protein n=1 Tax=Leishmania sp. Ghana 2012 LV757 TaxID=2803181 RepID=UPI001B4012DA|nr:hypothetical protein GH5_05619 [Leishmania sp. Ghana 2012 LV757]